MSEKGGSDHAMRPYALFMVTPFVRLLPETRFFGLKRWLYRICGVRLSSGVRICSSATFLGHGELSIGKDTWVGHQVLIVTGSSVDIGDQVDLAPRVMIGTGTHERGTGTKAAGKGIQKPVTIGDGCWLGAGCLVLPGINIAPSTIVGAGAVVVRNTRNGATVAGNPARELSAKHAGSA